MIVTADQWKRFAPNCPANYTAALFDNIDLLQDAGILDNELRWCHFAATVYHETGNFSEIRENLSYSSAKRLREVWPSRFGHKSDAELKPLLKAPKALAEAVYGGRMGNRPGTTDAYDTRGGGWFNTTGHGIVAGYCQKLGVPYSSGVLDDPVLTLKFAALEWKETNCNACADENDATKVAKAINTGSATSNVKPVGMNDRQRAFARAWKIWGESGKADVPARTVTVTDVAKVAVPAAAGVPVAVQEVAKVVQTPSLPAPPTAILESATAWKGFSAQVLEFGTFAVTNPKSIAVIGLTVAAYWFGPKVAPKLFGKE